MSRNREIIPLPFKLDGGLNLHDDAMYLEDNQLSICKNFNVYRGRLEKRNSFEQVAAHANFAAKRVRFLGQYTTSIGGISQLFVTVENNVAAADSLYYTTNGSTWTAIAATTGHFYKAIHYADFMYFYDTGGNVRVWDGTNIVASAAILPGYIPSDLLLDRYFMFGYNNYNQTVRYSNPGAIGTFPAANSIALPFNEGNDTITSMVAYKDRLVIFKKNSISVLHISGTPINWQLKKFMEGIGNTGLYSTVKAEDWIYFIDRKGIYRTNLSTVEEISGPLKEVFKDRKSIINNGVGSSIPVYGLYDSIAYYRNMIICSVNVIKPAASASSRRHRIFVYHIDTQVWTEWVPNITSDDANDFNPPQNMLTVEETAVVTATYNPYPVGVYCGSMELNGQVFRYSPFNTAPFTDYDGQYSCQFRTKSYTLDAPMELKKIPYTTIDAVPDSTIRITTQHYVNEVASGSPVVGLAGTFDGNTRIRGPGYAREYGMDCVFDVPSGADTTGLIVKEIGVSVRIPRPIQPKQLV